MARQSNKRAPREWTISREINPLGVAAFLLSVMALSAQLIAWARGPDVRLFPVERVALYSDVTGDQAAVVRIAAQISYANVASQAFGTLVLKETAYLNAGPLSSEQQWNAFGTITKKADGIAVQSTEMALPVPLAGQVSKSHLTLFAPLRKRCDNGDRHCNPTANYISPEELAGALARTGEIRLAFTVTLSDGTELRTSCSVTVGPANRPYLMSLRDHVFFGVCYPVGDDRS
jgi:hypothetical protein